MEKKKIATTSMFSNWGAMEFIDNYTENQITKQIDTKIEKIIIKYIGDDEDDWKIQIWATEQLTEYEFDLEVFRILDMRKATIVAFTHYTAQEFFKAFKSYKLKPNEDNDLEYHVLSKGNYEWDYRWIIKLTTRGDIYDEVFKVGRCAGILEEQKRPQKKRRR